MWLTRLSSIQTNLPERELATMIVASTRSLTEGLPPLPADSARVSTRPLHRRVAARPAQVLLAEFGVHLDTVVGNRRFR